MQRFFKATLQTLTRPLMSESNFKVMGLITLNERDETILALRVTVCGSSDGKVIKLHHEFRSMVILIVCEVDCGVRGGLDFDFYILFRFDIVSCY